MTTRIAGKTKRQGKDHLDARLAGQLLGPLPAPQPHLRRLAVQHLGDADAQLAGLDQDRHKVPRSSTPVRSAMLPQRLVARPRRRASRPPCGATRASGRCPTARRRQQGRFEGQPGLDADGHHVQGVGQGALIWCWRPRARAQPVAGQQVAHGRREEALRSAVASDRRGPAAGSSRRPGPGRQQPQPQEVEGGQPPGRPAWTSISWTPATLRRGSSRPSQAQQAAQQGQQHPAGKGPAQRLLLE
jgi:hypothetical protein